MKISIAKCAGLAAAALPVIGCVSSTAGLPISVVEPEATYCVQLQPNDGRNLAESIAMRMNARARSATSSADCSGANADYLVTYTDRWQWDMRMYLRALRVEIRALDTEALAAYGESQQNSLGATGENFETIIDRTLDEIFP